MSPWQALDQIHGWRATDSEWRRVLADAYPAIQPLLVTEDAYATEILIEPERRPRIIVMHSKSDIVAISRDTDESLPLRLEDVVLRALRPKRLCDEISKHLRLGKPDDDWLHGGSAWRLGEFIPYEGERFPTYLVPGHSAALRCQAIKAIAGCIKSPFVVVVLHAGNACDQLCEVATRCKAGVVVVEHAMRLLDGMAARAPHESFREQLDTFVQDHVRPTDHMEVGQLRFPTPPGSKWSEVKMRFLDNETVTVSCKGVQRKLRYDQLGFTDGRNGKPDTQWALLRVFANDGGAITWRSEGARQERRKQVQRLNDRLREFFLIEGAPIAHDDEIGGWRTPIDLQQ